MDKKKRLVIGIMGVAVMLIGLAFAVAYFVTDMDNSKKMTANLNTGTMTLVFSDGNDGIDAKLSFGESITKKFTIENTGTLEASLSLDWDKMLNTYLDGSLTYVLNRTDASGNLVEKIIEKTNVPTSNDRMRQTLVGELSVPRDEMYYYDLTITFNSLDINQENDKTAIFNTKFDVSPASRYKQYALTVDPNGGTWETFTAPQEYPLMNGETKTISNPTREGYTFDGWDIRGTSSTIEAGTFKMGIADSSLVAKWKPMKVTVSVDLGGTPNTQEGEYGGTITLEEPTKDGYNFEGWEATGATVNGNTITITDPDNVTVKPIWSPNNYQYIVYHNKMTTSGTYAPVGVDTDKDTGEKPMDTVFQPEIRTTFGDGFKVPALKDLRITSNAENNKLTYEYERNKFQLTVDTDGGTGGTSSQEVYYEASLTLEAPTKTGYNFTNWTKTAGEGTLTDGVITMGLQGITVQAGWTAKTIPVTLNANGGIFDNDSSITTKSTTVTYGSTYGAGTLGSLPKPTRSGYDFVGWYTVNSSYGGAKIIDSTSVAITSGQTLYARWEVEKFSVPKAVTAILNSSSVSGYTSYSPFFSEAAKTDAGVYAMADDYGTSYYYRGAVTNNYVKFGGFYWRIIRINGDGSLRMIYDGTSYHANGYTADGYIKTNQPFNAKAGDAKYAGYMYGGSSKDAASTSAADAQTNTYDSDIKIVVDDWYESNIKVNARNSNKDLTKYLADAIFCVDRTLPAEGEIWSNSEQDTKHSNLGWAAHETPYGAYHRFRTVDNKANENPKPTFKCSDNTITGNKNNDRFTVSDTKKGNGALTYPIGLITADEIVAAGSGKFDFSTLNNKYYLYRGTGYLWSLSPGIMMYMGNAYVFMVNSGGGVEEMYLSSSSGAVAPVINLKAEYAQQLIGTGVKNDEYRLLGVN